MRLIFLLFLIGTFAGLSVGQDFAKYFEIKAEKYKEDDGEYVGVSPALKENATDNLGKFIAEHPRRFRYLLANNSQFQGLDSLYPDVLKMNKIYLERLSADEKFTKHFEKLTLPASLKKFEKEKFKKTELMKVASRFFFCDTVKPDKSIGSHICIALNGLKEAQFDKDYTILEAFCFEAIFQAIEEKAPVRTKFVENFLAYIEEISKKERQNNSNSETYLKNVRLAVFERMQADAELEKMLLEYYRKNTENLSFEVSE